MNMYVPKILTGPASQQRRTFFLALGAAVMIAAAFLVAPVVGPPIAIAAMLYGWVAAWLIRPAEPAPAARPAAAAPMVPPPASNAVLRHDLRGILSPALLVTDSLMMHADPAVQRAGEIIVRTVQRVTQRLDDGREAGADFPPGPQEPL